jgi:hypothetical protein
VAGILCSREEGNLFMADAYTCLFMFFYDILAKRVPEHFVVSIFKPLVYSKFFLHIFQAGNIEEASNVYWRAKKALNNPSSFLERYQLLR